MAREPTSIIEAFACHPSAVVEVRVRNDRGSTLNWVWHGACVSSPDANVLTAMGLEDAELFVHEHVRDYYADCPNSNDHDLCAYCHNQASHLPRSVHYE